MQNQYKTQRLFLDELSLNDAEFICNLVNTEGWIKFIGERNISNKDDALPYIQKILDNPLITYWVVRKINQVNPIGIITLIKRDYLDHPDIGFAFLPDFGKQGYAFEAAKVVLLDLLNQNEFGKILATTIKENINSIRLLEKLGLQFEKEILAETEELLVYAISNDPLL